MDVDWQAMDVDLEEAALGHQAGAGLEQSDEAAPPAETPTPEESEGQVWRDFCCSCLSQVDGYIHYFGRHQLCTACWKSEWKDFGKDDGQLKKWMSPSEYQQIKESFKQEVCKYLDYRCRYCCPDDASADMIPVPDDDQD